MRSQGIEIDNENDLIIGYEGASDDNGISDSLASQFQVYRYVNKKVPYKVEEEYVYGGELTEEEAALPKEERDKLIFDYMRKEGKLDSDESNYDIVIDGSVDSGYDTPVIGYSVYKITSKERLEEDTKYSEEEKKEEKEKLEEASKTLKEEREKLNSIGNVEEKNKAIEELLNKVGNIENNVSSDVKDFSMFNKELEEIDEEIKKLKKDINASADNYQATYQKLQDVIDEQNAKMDNEKLVRFLLTFFLGWIGSLIINHTSLKPEGYRSRTLAYLVAGYITCGIYSLVASICNLFFDPNKEKNIGWKKD